MKLPPALLSRRMFDAEHFFDTRGQRRLKGSFGRIPIVPPRFGSHPRFWRLPPGSNSSAGVPGESVRAKLSGNCELVSGSARSSLILLMICLADTLGPADYKPQQHPSDAWLKDTNTFERHLDVFCCLAKRRRGAKLSGNCGPVLG